MFVIGDGNLLPMEKEQDKIRMTDGAYLKDDDLSSTRNTRSTRT
ncbi:hypothetical protein [Streptomyces aquilus]|nr:hypothetical protein [Streptomyces aquilus]